MNKDTIITLEDNTEYALLDETTLDGNKYFFALKVDEKGNPTKEFEIFLEEIMDNDTYMDIVEEGELKQSLMISFSKNYKKNIEIIMEEDAN